MDVGQPKGPAPCNCAAARSSLACAAAMTKGRACDKHSAVARLIGSTRSCSLGGGDRIAHTGEVTANAGPLGSGTAGRFCSRIINPAPGFLRQGRIRSTNQRKQAQHESPDHRLAVRPSFLVRNPHDAQFSFGFDTPVPCPASLFLSSRSPPCQRAERLGQHRSPSERTKSHLVTHKMGVTRCPTMHAESVTFITLLSTLTMLLLGETLAKFPITP